LNLYFLRLEKILRILSLEIKDSLGSVKSPDDNGFFKIKFTVQRV